MLRLLYWSIWIVLLLAATAVFGAPPQRLLDTISATSTIVYDKRCNVASLKLANVECIITYDRDRDVVYIFIFSDDLDITHIIAVKDEKETILWQDDKNRV